VKPILISDDAELDFVEALDWYKKIEIDLALSFRDVIIAGFSEIQKSPKLWSAYGDLYRRYTTKNFPIP
jgi:hypothetical protein